VVSSFGAEGAALLVSVADIDRRAAKRQARNPFPRGLCS
jgi:hypothetical protein